MIIVYFITEKGFLLAACKRAASLTRGNGLLFIPNEGVAMLESIGFSCLQNTENNVERVVDCVFSHPDAINNDSCAPAPCAAPANESTCVDGDPVYELGVISLIRLFVTPNQNSQSWGLLYGSWLSEMMKVPPKRFGCISETSFNEKIPQKNTYGRISVN